MRVLHFSDIHLQPSFRGVPLSEWLGKRLIGAANLRLRRWKYFVQAAETFKRAHQILPGDVDILHRLAVAQRRTPDLEGAIASFTLAMDLDPNHSRSPTTM